MAVISEVEIYDELQRLPDNTFKQKFQVTRDDAVVMANGQNLREFIPTVGKVKSVNGKTGTVVIDVPDIAGLNHTNIKIGDSAIVSQGSSSTTAIGQSASVNGAGPTALGESSKASGTSALALGGQSEATGNYSIGIGTWARSVNPNEGILGHSVFTNKWRVPGNFTVEGTKNFEIPHPKPSKSATHIIRHGAVESPSAGDTLYRYKVTSTKENDLQLIDLPDYFIHLNKDVQIFVTPQEHFSNGYGKLNRDTEQLEIHCQSAGEYNVLVIGTRNDNHQSVKDWDIKGVEREIGESWNGETYVFEVEEMSEVEEIKEEVI